MSGYPAPLTPPDRILTVAGALPGEAGRRGVEDLQLLAWHSCRIGRGMAAGGDVARAEGRPAAAAAGHSRRMGTLPRRARRPRTRPRRSRRACTALEAVFAPLASSYAHPRELEEQREFVEAVRLLQGPDVPLYTVMQYVTGTNWTLACAALAALIGRPDRDDAVDDVLAHFDKLYPWPIYFALTYFAVAEPRPPVGAPVVGAKDWWCDNVILPGFFRDYFAAARAPRRRARVRLGAAGDLCLAARHDQGIPAAGEPSACHRADPAARHLPARQHRSHVPLLVRPLLGGPQGAGAAGRARGVARGPVGRRDRLPADADAIAARQRRSPRGQDVVPAAAGATASKARAGRSSRPAVPT